MTTASNLAMNLYELNALPVKTGAVEEHGRERSASLWVTIQTPVDLGDARESRLFMLGSVRTKEKCPGCGGEFEPVRHPTRKQKVLDLQCPKCLTRPRRYFVDARAFKDGAGSPGRIFCDTNGIPFDSFDSAMRTLEAMRREMDEHRFDSMRWRKDARRRMMLSEVCMTWFEHFEIENPDGDHVKCVKSFFKWHILPEHGHMDVRQLRGLDIQKLYKTLLDKGRDKDGNPREEFKHRKPLPGEGPIRRNTVHNILRSYHACLNWLKKMDVIERVPTFPPTPAVELTDVQWLDLPDQARVLSHIPGYARLVIETMIETGARPGSVVAAKVKDLEDGGIRIERAFTSTRRLKKTKTGATSWKALSTDLYEQLVASASGKNPDDFLFTNTQGNPFATGRVSDIWRAARKKANVKVCLYVSVRHSRVSQKRRDLERKMMDELRKVLDHYRFETTRKYYLRGKEDMFKQNGDGTNEAPASEDAP